MTSEIIPLNMPRALAALAGNAPAVCRFAEWCEGRGLSDLVLEGAARRQLNREPGRRTREAHGHKGPFVKHRRGLRERYLHLGITARRGGVHSGCNALKVQPHP